MNSRPNVAVMCFSGNNGGMELDTIKLAELLCEACDVTLLCKHGSFIHQRLQNQTRIDYVPVKFLSRKFSFSMLFTVRNVIKARKLRNVVFFGASELKTLYFAFAGLDLNIIVRHGTTKTHRKKSLVHRLIYSCVNYHVALSEHLLRNVKYIVPHNGTAQYKIIYPSFEIEKHVDEIHADRLMITHVGRIAEGKGQLDALMACRQLYDAGIDFQLNIVGSGGQDDYARKVESYIAGCPFADRVNLTGFMDEPQTLVRISDIFLFPSFGEGMPNSFIEALHYGVPCLAYDNTVFPEYIKMGFHLLLARDRDVSDLGDRLLYMVENIDSEKRASHANSKLAEDYFNRQKELANWLGLFI